MVTNFIIFSDAKIRIIIRNKNISNGNLTIFCIFARKISSKVTFTYYLRYCRPYAKTWRPVTCLPKIAAVSLAFCRRLFDALPPANQRILSRNSERNDVSLTMPHSFT